MPSDLAVDLSSFTDVFHQKDESHMILIAPKLGIRFEGQYLYVNKLFCVFGLLIILHPPLGII
jgi:hypothetical protein